MKLPDFITFSGVDDLTSIDAMIELSRRYQIEWGVLFSPKRQGVDPRYPRNDTLAKLASRTGLRLSAHLCGDHARGIMEGRPFALGKGVFTRVQVNHPDPVPEEIAKLSIRGIAQCHDDFPAEASIDWLCDSSCGRGVGRKHWPEHPGDRLVGYAGGINPENVIETLSNIGATGPYWIDMETGVRTDDRLDLEKCRQVCEAVYGSAA